MATYYVDGAVGNDGNLGTSEGAGNAWATISKASSASVTAGDICYIKASADYTNEYFLPSVTGTAEAPIRWIGYTSTPGDGGRCKLVRTSSTTYGVLDFSGHNHLRWENVWWLDYDQYGVYSTSTNDYWSLYNCLIDNCGTGVTANDHTLIEDCVIQNCATQGVTTDLYTTLINSQFLDNGGTNVLTEDNYTVAVNCVFAGNAGTTLFTTQDLSVVMNCVFDGQNTDIGLQCTDATFNTVLVNNVFYDCTTGLSALTGTYQWSQICAHNNLFYSNTTDYSAEWPTYLKADDITGSDPAFANPATYDYTIDSDSPCYEAGWPANMHIGVSHPAAPVSRVILIG